MKIDVCSHKHGAEKILKLVEHLPNVSHTAIRSVYPYVHTLIKSKLTINCTTVYEALSIKDSGVINIPTVLAKSMWRRMIDLNCNCSDDFTS